MILGYKIMQDQIGSAFKAEEKRVCYKLDLQLTAEIKSNLDNLFNKGPEKYLITCLQCDAQTFQLKSMKKERGKLNLCRGIYKFSKQFLSELGLSQAMISYYADLIHVYKRHRLSKINRSLAYLYLICYVHERYERIMNNLVQGFFYHVDKQDDLAKQYADGNLPKNLGPLECYQTELGKLIEIFTKEKIMTGNGPSIKEHAFNILPKESISAISNELLGQNRRQFRQRQVLIWKYHKKNSQRVVLNLRPLFSAIEFDDVGEMKDLFKACIFWQKLLNSDKTLENYSPSRVPMNHIYPKALQEQFKSVIRTKRGKRTVVNPQQYEFYLYRMLRGNIKNRKVSINSSTEYKSFDAEVNTPKNWKKTAKERLASLNNKKIIQPIEDILSELESELEPLLERTNRRASNGENKQIRIVHRRDGSIRWTLPYPKKNPEFDNPFYKQLDIKTISEIFDFVAKECPFMRMLTHIKSRQSHNKQDYLAIKAVILANGTMQGTHLFAKRSNLGYKRLKVAEDNHIRLESLRSAADIILDKMIDLPIYELYLINNKLHGSVDGKKKKTRRRLLRARYSSKYFGTDVGFVLMTMGVGHIPMATNIIGANEHESHYTFPMLMQNNHIIDPDIISTDTEGANNVNDLLYYLIGKTHAPCYRTIATQADKICGFKPLSHYKDYIIKPDKPVNKVLIKRKWPEILPILYGLLSHDSKQENIIRQLSSHDYKSEVKDAIWELNRIPKSIHILKYIDDVGYQQAIRTALNRGEAYHQLLDKIAEVGGGDFRGKSDMEVEIWNECMRFIAILIIYYNMSLLSKLLKIYRAKGNDAAIKYLASVSPVACQHLNISGLYEFNEEPTEIDIDGMVTLMEKILDETLQKGGVRK